MILAFGAIEAAGNVEPSLVAGGIKVALLTTAAGLVIAVPVNIGYNFFVTRIDTLIVDMEHGAQKIINVAWDLEKDGVITILKQDDPILKELATKAASAPAPTAPAAPESAQDS